MTQGILSNESRAERHMLAKALSDTPEGVEGVIARRFPWDELYTKAAAPAISADGVNAASSTSAEFTRHLTRNSVVAAILDRTMKVSFQSVFNSPFAAQAEFVPEGHAIPAFSDALTPYLLDSKKVGAVAVMTAEALQQENAERALAMAMSETCGNALDEYFLDAAAHKSDAPTPITVGATTMAATNDPAASLRALMRNLSSWSSPVLIMNPELGVQLNLSTAGGASPFVDVGALGGTLAGVQVLTSQSAPFDSSGGDIILIDCSRLAVALGGVNITRTTEATLILQDTIDSNGTGADLVSLFQAEAVAIKALMFANWAKLDDDAVRVLSGCDW
ncbi:MAG: phage major capsid protein [Gammaproteobacteria bacterium]|nr:phage major capsid protein [Gammaproteobacteria bacterium]